jgi:hypothetical protein
MESRWKENAPAAFTSPPDPASLDLKGLGVGERLFADADTFLLLRGGGGFSGHGG